MRKFLQLVAVLALAVTAFGQGAAPMPITDGFHGSWAGVLEYRDYSNNEMTQLPTWLDLTATGDAITFAYTYDDGPTKTVRERVTLTLAGDHATLRAQSQGKPEEPADTFTVTGLADFAKLHRVTLTLLGNAKDNDKPAEIRITLTLRRNLLTWRKEVRPAGGTEPFKFRDGYTFTRTTVPL